MLYILTKEKAETFVEDVVSLVKCQGTMLGNLYSRLSPSLKADIEEAWDRGFSVHAVTKYFSQSSTWI